MRVTFDVYLWVGYTLMLSGIAYVIYFKSVQESQILNWIIVNIQSHIKELSPERSFMLQLLSFDKRGRIIQRLPCLSVVACLYTRYILITNK